MGASFDGTTGNVILAGDNVGWSRMKIALPTPPAGTDQAIYVMRYFVDTFPSNITQAEISGDVRNRFFRILKDMI